MIQQAGRISQVSALKHGDLRYEVTVTGTEEKVAPSLE